MIAIRRVYRTVMRSTRSWRQVLASNWELNWERLRFPAFRAGTPLIGLADRIVDMVETGQTLKENGLVEMNSIFEITSRLIANRVSYRMKNDEIQTLGDRLQAVILSERANL